MFYYGKKRKTILILLIHQHIIFFYIFVSCSMPLCFTGLYLQFVEKKREILPFAATNISLAGIVLSGISHSKKDKYCIMSHMWN